MLKYIVPIKIRVNIENKDLVDSFKAEKVSNVHLLAQKNKVNIVFIIKHQGSSGKSQT